MIRHRRFVQFKVMVAVSLGLLGLLVMINRAQASPEVQAIQTARVSTTAATVSTCQPYTASVNPTQLPLTAAESGLTQVIEQPATYRIYGLTGDDLRRQVTDCAPKSYGSTQAEFTAETSYRLSWQYDYQAQDDGMCTVRNIKLGLHVGMVLPEWHASAQTQAGLSAQWHTFMANLRTHEDGHVALDVQYSQQLLATLQALPATDCNTITTETDNVINHAVDSLNQANEQYDTVTNHGATQGAILP